MFINSFIYEMNLVVCASLLVYGQHSAIFPQKCFLKDSKLYESMMILFFPDFNPARFSIVSPPIVSAKRTTTTIFSTINRRRERSSSPAPSTLPASLASHSSRQHDADDAGDGTSGVALTTTLHPSNDSRSTPSSPTPGKRIRARSQDRGVV